MAAKGHRNREPWTRKLSCGKGENTGETPGSKGKKEVREADIGKEADQLSGEPGTESLHGGTGLKAANELSRLRCWRQQ